VLIAVVANLVIMGLLVVYVVRQRRADERSRNRSATAATGGGATPGGGVTAGGGATPGEQPPAKASGTAAATIGAATAVGPVIVSSTAADDEVQDEKPPVVTTPSGQVGEDRPGTDGTDMDEGMYDLAGDPNDEGGVVRPRRFTLPPVEDPRGGAFAAYLASGGHDDDEPAAIPIEPDYAPAPTHGSNGVLTDPATGVDNTRAWARSLSEEAARSARYGRPVTVVIAEIDGLDRLAERFGTESADRLVPPVADALRRNARAADRVARLSGSRFGVLLTETDEVRAINYVERVRAACDRWLEAGAVAVRLSIGWASPPAGSDLAAAVHEAEERMYREQRRAAPWRSESGVRPASSPETDTDR